MPLAFIGINPGDLLGRAGQGNPGFLPDVFGDSKFGIPRQARLNLFEI